MQTIEIQFFIKAPLESVFEAAGDHESFLGGSEKMTCQITKPGRKEKNGAGALRRVRTRGLEFVEEITHFERPSRYDYLIRECTLPMDHRGGRLDFVSKGGGTQIRWTTTYTLRVPVLGGLLAALLKPALRAGFLGLLERTKKRLEGGKAA